MNAFNGVKIFFSTLARDREVLGEHVTRWIEEARRTRPGFQIVNIDVRQSSDEAYHCTSITIFFNERLEKRR